MLFPLPKPLIPILWFLSLLPGLSALTLDKPNILLLCVDDLRPELHSFGAKYIKSPNIDRLANRGRPFHKHYVQAPTCGASRFTLLTGKYGPSHNGALFLRSKNIQHPSLPAWQANGYTRIGWQSFSSPRRKREKTGMRMGISRCLNHGADAFFLQVHGNIRGGLCTAWQMVKFGRMQRTWTSTSPSMGRTPPTPMA